MNELIKPDPYFGGVVDSLPMLTKNTDKAALEWVVTMREGLRQMRDSGGCISMVRYEELIDSPKQVLSDIANFAGLRPDDKILRYGESILQLDQRKRASKCTLLLSHFSMQPWSHSIAFFHSQVGYRRFKSIRFGSRFMLAASTSQVGQNSICSFSWYPRRLLCGTVAPSRSQERIEVFIA